MRAVDQIPEAKAKDVSAALPTIMEALHNSDENVKKYAALALYAIARRQGSSLLLSDYLNEIGSLTNLSDPHLQGAAPLIFLELKPNPPAQTVSILVQFLQRTDRDIQAQSSAVFALARIAPDRPDAVLAMRGFLARDLGTVGLISALNSVGNGHITDSGIVGEVIRALRHPDARVRFTTAQVVGRMGPAGLRKAEPELQRISSRPDEDPTTRAAADALRRIRGMGSPPNQ